MSERLGRSDPGEWLRFESVALFGPLIARLGPIALLSLQTSGPPERRSAQLLDVALLLFGGIGEDVVLRHSLIRPPGEVPALITRLSGRHRGDFERAPTIDALRDELDAALGERALITFDAAPCRHFLSRFVSTRFAGARILDAQDVLEVTHPDAEDVTFKAYARAILGEPEHHRADRDVLTLGRMLLTVASGAEEDEGRHQVARRAMERFTEESPWLALLGKGGLLAEVEGSSHYVEVGASEEPPVPFDEEAIAAALRDEARGRRHFRSYRVREEQIRLARAFQRNFAGGGALLLEGGTGIGKSLAYLAAAIPFAMERAERGDRQPILISTRTKLLQDQLLGHDIAAAARFLGHPGVRALSIKGRANYVCERRLGDALASGRDLSLLAEDRQAFCVLQACARTRPGGEVGSLPLALLRRHPILRDLIGRSVARRAEQCTREECGGIKSCPFGLRRRALAKAHLVVANHDLLLRWPPDYPAFGHVVVDEGHELAGVADDVYATVVRPEELIDRIDEVFGAPGEKASSARRAGEPERGLLPRKQRLEAAQQVRDARRALLLDFGAMGRGLSGRASEYGEVQLPPRADRLFPGVAELADTCARRLEVLARLAEELDARAEWTFDEAPEAGSEGPSPVQKNAQALREAASGLRMAFSADSHDVVSAFERLVMPYDRWTLIIRSVSPASDFHQLFLEPLESFAAVSASLFVGGDAFAALGELEIEERSAIGVDRVSLPSPFDYERHMRVLAMAAPDDPVAETAHVLGLLARELRGRTLGLFTSLRRMNEVAEMLTALLQDTGMEILAPRRAADDPASLVRRFREAPDGAVLLGARTFWQGLDVPGDDLQAVVIEKLPFEVPTELRKRREQRLREMGVDAFGRYSLGKMLLHLKQMTGRLVRGEADRGAVVIVDARPDRRYFRDLEKAFPPGTRIRLGDRSAIPGLLAEIGLGVGTNSAPIGCPGDDSRS